MPPRLVLPAGPKPPPPPPLVRMVVASGTYCFTRSSRRYITASVIGILVPIGSCALILTWPSSVCGSSSVPTRGYSTAARTTRPAPAPATVGPRCRARARGDRRGAHRAAPRRSADDGRPVLQREVDRAAIPLVHAIEERLAGAV